MKLSDIGQELKGVLTGKTMDALLPPIIYLIGNALGGIVIGIIFALLFALIAALRRYFRKSSIVYSLVGVFGVLFASTLALIAKTPAGYYIPGMLTSGLLLVLCLGTILLRKPLAAYASHLSRGWSLAWFWRKDIRPAYMEVTWFWMIFFGLRLYLQLTIYLAEDVTRIGWVNTLLGTPATIVVLILTYVYGIWRLRTLKGPSVDEFLQGMPKPWEGQKKGF